MHEFFNYIIDNPSIEDDVDDFDTTCKIKNEDKMIT
jgi:hypothetical protein